MNRYIKRGATILASSAILGVSGIAFAYWSAPGEGTASAATGDAKAIVITQTAPLTTLYPGGSIPLSGKFTNSNPGSVFVTSVSATVDADSLVLLAPKCIATDFKITGSATVGHEIVSGENVDGWSGLTITMADTAISQDACKLLKIPLKLTSN